MPGSHSIATLKQDEAVIIKFLLGPLAIDQSDHITQFLSRNENFHFMVVRAYVNTNYFDRSTVTAPLTAALER